MLEELIPRERAVSGDSYSAELKEKALSPLLFTVNQPAYSSSGFM